MILDVREEIARTRQTQVGQRQIRKMLLAACKLFKDKKQQTNATTRVNRFVPQLFLKAPKLKQEKAEEVKQQVKSRWGRATTVVSLRAKKEFVAEAPLMSCRPVPREAAQDIRTA